MTVISKPLFYEKVGADLQCTHIHFWEESCLRSNLSLSRITFLGSLKFFLPIYILKAVINHKKLKEKSFWRKLLIEEVRSSFYGVLLGNLFLISNCVLCKLAGRINYYNIGFISGLVSGLAVLVETKENHMLDTLIFFNMLVEATLTNLYSFNILRRTTARETVLFMLVSSLLMYLLQNREEKIRFTNFWFYTPHLLKKNEDDMAKNMIEQKCQHEESCLNFTLVGTQRYFILGYVFSIVRKVIPKMLTVFRNPSKLLNIMVNKDNVKFGAFIGAYVGIYRYVMCYLLKTNGLSPKYFGAIAGLISGATYAVSPNLQVLSVGITTILQVFYNTVLRRLNIKNQLIPQQIVYMVSHSLLLHNAIMSKDTCPTYYINMLNTCTNNMYIDIYKELIEKYIL